MDGVGHASGSQNRIWTDMAEDLLAALSWPWCVWTHLLEPRRATHRRQNDGQTMRRIIERDDDLRGTAKYIAKDDANTTLSVPTSFSRRPAGFRRWLRTGR